MKEGPFHLVPPTEAENCECFLPSSRLRSANETGASRGRPRLEFSVKILHQQLEFTYIRMFATAWGPLYADLN